MLTFNQTDGGRRALGYKGETNDCVVKSLAIALGRPYHNVHSDLKARGRVNGKGTQNFIWTPYIREIPGVREIEGIGQKRMNVWNFFQRHQKGTFLVVVTRHLTVIKDGIYLDEIPPRPRQLVRSAFEVTDVLPLAEIDFSI